MLDIFTLKRKVIRWFDEPITPADLDRMTIHELFAVCNTDPAHVEIAPWDVIPDWQREAEADHADFMDLKRTQEESRF